MTPMRSARPLESPGETSSLREMSRRTLVELEVPPYLVGRPGPGDAFLFYFQVPKRHRPEGWPGARRLPLDPKKRTGLGDHAEWTAAIEDAKALYDRLSKEKAAKPVDAAPHGTIVWLIARITDPAINAAWDDHSEATRLDYQSDFRALKAWSVEMGHPPVATIARSTITAFVNRYRKTPFKQAHIKTALRYVFQQALADDLVQASPIDRQMKLARRPKSQPKEWPAEVTAAICDLAIRKGRPSIAKAIWTKWGRGLRNTDLLALRCPDHVFKEDGVWMINVETSKRAVPVIVRLPAEAAALHEAELAELERQKVTPGPRPFLINEETKKAWHVRAWNKNVSDLLAHPDVNRPDLKPGWLRHTVMTHVDEAGASDAAGAALVGHSPAAHAALKDRHYRIRTKALAEQGVAALEAHRARRQNKERKSDGSV